MQDLQAVAEVAIVEAAKALRNTSLLPRMVSRRYDAIAGEQNSSIQVPVWPAMTSNPVVAGPGNESAAQALKPDKVTIVLDQWDHVKWQVDDKEMAEIMVGTRVTPEAQTRAVIKLADNVNIYIHGGLLRHSYNNVLQAGAAATITELIALKKALDKENVEQNPRSLVTDHDTDSDLLGLDTFHAADKSGSSTTQTTGILPGKFGFNTIHPDGQIPHHTAGDAAGTILTNLSATIVANPAQSGGTTKGIGIDGGTVSTNFVPGDYITFAGDTQKYVIVAKTGDVLSGTIEIAPQLKVDLADGVAVTVHADTVDHQVAAFGFHESAYAFATRPMQPIMAPNVAVASALDPLSGLTMRLQIEYINYMHIWKLDLLYGGAVVYPEMITRFQNND